MVMHSPSIRVISQPTAADGALEELRVACAMLRTSKGIAATTVCGRFESVLTPTALRVVVEDLIAEYELAARLQAEGGGWSVRFTVPAGQAVAGERGEPHTFISLRERFSRWFHCRCS